MIFGPKKFENYPEGKEDNSHLVYDGAIMISKLFVEEILKLMIQLRSVSLI